jgi:hypothetical protein
VAVAGIPPFDPPSSPLRIRSADGAIRVRLRHSFAPLALLLQCVTRVKGSGGSDALLTRAGAGKPLTPRGARSVKRVRFRKEVSAVQYKITRVYVVEAESSIAALELLKRVANPLKHLVYETIRPLIEPAPRSSWGSILKRQLFGSKLS